MLVRDYSFICGACMMTIIHVHMCGNVTCVDQNRIYTEGFMLYINDINTNKENLVRPGKIEIQLIVRQQKKENM
jgi:hypothetical protein